MFGNVDLIPKKELVHNKLKIDLTLHFLCPLFKTASSAVSQIPLCQRILGSNQGLLLLWHRQSDALTIPLDLIHFICFLSITIYVVENLLPAISNAESRRDCLGIPLFHPLDKPFGTSTLTLVYFFPNCLFDGLASPIKV
jgi:hypothetical protein